MTEKKDVTDVVKVAKDTDKNKNVISVQGVIKFDKPATRRMEVICHMDRSIRSIVHVHQFEKNTQNYNFRFEFKNVKPINDFGGSNLRPFVVFHLFEVHQYDLKRILCSVAVPTWLKKKKSNKKLKRHVSSQYGKFKGFGSIECTVTMPTKLSKLLSKPHKYDGNNEFKRIGHLNRYLQELRNVTRESSFEKRNITLSGGRSSFTGRRKLNTTIQSNMYVFLNEFDNVNHLKEYFRNVYKALMRYYDLYNKSVTQKSSLKYNPKVDWMNLVLWKSTKIDTYFPDDYDFHTVSYISLIGDCEDLVYVTVQQKILFDCIQFDKEKDKELIEMQKYSRIYGDIELVLVSTAGSKPTTEDNNNNNNNIARLEFHITGSSTGKTTSNGTRVVLFAESTDSYFPEVLEKGEMETYEFKTDNKFVTNFTQGLFNIRFPKPVEFTKGFYKTVYQTFSLKGGNNIHSTTKTGNKYGVSFSSYFKGKFTVNPHKSVPRKLALYEARFKIPPIMTQRVHFSNNYKFPAIKEAVVDKYKDNKIKGLVKFVGFFSSKDLLIDKFVSKLDLFSKKYTVTLEEIVLSQQNPRLNTCYMVVFSKE